MSVISVTITESTEQIVSGKPKFITIETNIPANIYYTLDGADPTTMSDIYIDKIYLPYEQNTLIVKVFATNGVDESPIIENKYSHEYPENLRRPRTVTDSNSSKSKQLYPFGTNEYYPSTDARESQSRHGSHEGP